MFPVYVDRRDLGSLVVHLFPMDTLQSSDSPWSLATVIQSVELRNNATKATIDLVDSPTDNNEVHPSDLSILRELRNLYLLQLFEQAPELGWDPNNVGIDQNAFIDTPQMTEEYGSAVLAEWDISGISISLIIF